MFFWDGWQVSFSVTNLFIEPLLPKTPTVDTSEIMQQFKIGSLCHPIFTGFLHPGDLANLVDSPIAGKPFRSTQNMSVTQPFPFFASEKTDLKPTKIKTK